MKECVSAYKTDMTTAVLSYRAFSGIIVSHRNSAKQKIERLRTPPTAQSSRTLGTILQQNREKTQI